MTHVQPPGSATTLSTSEGNHAQPASRHNDDDHDDQPPHQPMVKPGRMRTGRGMMVCWPASHEHFIRLQDEPAAHAATPAAPCT